ncbi:fructose-bisphosphate aldolase [Tanacetum coccineum]
MVLRAVLRKSGLVSINTVKQNISKTEVLVNTVRQINVVHSKTTVNATRPISKSVIDSGCSRHMTGNMSYLTNYEQIDGGYVAFGGNPKGGKITRKVSANGIRVNVGDSKLMLLDEAVHKELGDSLVRAAITASSLQAKQDSGNQFVDSIAECGVLSGIKVDQGRKKLGGITNEFTILGQDLLEARCKEYYMASARFAKWSATLTIGPNKPSLLARAKNMTSLAYYALICQEHGLDNQQ